MAVSDKEQLIDLLSEIHDKTFDMLKGIDLNLRVYGDSGWRIRDILGHLAAWDRQVSFSLQAYSRGKEYSIPDFDEDVFNNEDVRWQSGLTSEQVFDEWQSAREEFKDAVWNIPLNLFPDDLLYPWGNERGTVAHLVKEMTGHDEEHYSEILNIIQSSSEG